jgi:hypothetical protein
MSYLAEFEHHLKWAESLTQDVLQHAPPSGAAADRFRADLAGLLSTSYVAALECCIKEIFNSFARSKHQLLASVTSFHFDRINSAIHCNTIADKYTLQFGEPYRRKFRQLLKDEEAKVLATDKTSMLEAYQNIITWRHAFVHEGKKLASLDEVVLAFPFSKKIVMVLDTAMSL